MSFQELWRRTKPPQLGHRYRKFTRNSGLKNHGFPVPDTSGHIPSKIPEPYDLYPDRQIRISPKFHKVHLKFTAMVFRCCSFLSFCFFWGNQKVSKLGMHCTAGKILCGSCDDLFGESLGTTRHIDILIIMLWSYYDHYIAMYNKNSNLDSDSYYFYDLWHLRFFVLYNIILLWWWWCWWDQGEIPSVFLMFFSWVH